MGSLPIGSPHHREGGPDILEADQSADQRPFDGCLAFERKPQFDEERLDGLKIVNNDQYVVHPFELHTVPFLASPLILTSTDEP